MNRQQQLQAILDGVADAIPDLSGAMLATRDGLSITTTIHGDDASRVAAMAATVLALGARVVESTGMGQFQETVIQSSAGTFVVYDAGPVAVLAVLAQGGANLGLIHIEARRAAAQAADVLDAYRRERAEATTPSSAAAPEASTEPAYERVNI